MDGVGERWMIARDWFLFLSVFLPLKLWLLFKKKFSPTPIAGGREVRIDLQLFHLLLYHMFKQMLAFHIWEG